MLRRVLVSTGLLLGLSTALILLALLVGATLPGDRVFAFSNNPTRTRDIYVMDTSRGIYAYLRVFDHADELPVWSPQTRGIIYVPRVGEAREHPSLVAP